jgi:hypothetical protein
MVPLALALLSIPAGAWTVYAFASWRMRRLPKPARRSFSALLDGPTQLYAKCLAAALLWLLLAAA